MSIIKLSQINKSHALPILENINLEIQQGDFVSITGPSGCGKSTLLQIMGVLDNPDSGSYQLMGHEISKTKQDDQARLRNKHIGFVFQRYHLLEHLNILENICLPLEYQQTPVADPHKLAYKQLEFMQLSEKAACRPSQLSYGQQQRIAIARALITEPDIILADEPTGSLDPHNALRIMELLRELNKEGKTIILITHNLELIEPSDKHFTIKNKTLEQYS